MANRYYYLTTDPPTMPSGADFADPLKWWDLLDSITGELQGSHGAPAPGDTVYSGIIPGYGTPPDYEDWTNAEGIPIPAGLYDGNLVVGDTFVANGVSVPGWVNDSAGVFGLPINSNYYQDSGSNYWLSADLSPSVYNPDGFDVNGYDVNGFDANGYDAYGSAWPDYNTGLSYFEGVLADGYFVGTNPNGVDASGGWYVQGIFASFSHDFYLGNLPALDSNGTGVWDGYDSYWSGAFFSDLAGFYFGGVRTAFPAWPNKVTVAGAGTASVNGVYTKDSHARYALPVWKKGNYRLTVDNGGIGPWIITTDDFATNMYSSSGYDLSSEVISYPWQDEWFATDTGESPAPTVVQGDVGETDILLSGFPGSTTIFGTGLLAS